MPLNLDEYDTVDLLRMISSEEGSDEDFAYEALWGTVFPRWRKGIDLDPLVQLLRSEKSGERQRGAFYLEESGPPSHLVADTVIELSRDAVSYCRWKFVQYVTNSRLYSDAVAIGLAACLLDLDLHVRARTIFWAVVIGDQVFEHFSATIVSGAEAERPVFSDTEGEKLWRISRRKRAVRGVEIAQRLRWGEPVVSIRESMPEEDGYIFDELSSLDYAINRALVRRAAIAATEPG